MMKSVHMHFHAILLMMKNITNGWNGENLEISRLLHGLSIIKIHLSIFQIIFKENFAVSVNHQFDLNKIIS